VTSATHEPVLLEECLQLLDVRPGIRVLDGTLGLGGHAEAILQRSAPDGSLIGLDVDPAALERARRRLAPFGERATLVQASFRRLGAVLDELGVVTVDGLLLDLGVSSLQLDEPTRGFRFAEATAEETPLDMRMDPTLPDAAAELLAGASEQTLRDLLRRYGELPGAARLARAIVAARRERPLRTAADLLALVRDTGVGRGRKHHPATRVFQALRIAVNDELGALAEGLASGVERLAPGGRLVVIAYHSLEDRLVKTRIRELERGCICPPELPECRCGRRPVLRRLTRKPVRPTPEELRRNPRARSARLRAAERLAS
jgi:16S rRNA (cytosine1402-N4)-methyltransferase